MGLQPPQEADLSSIPLVGLSEEFLIAATTIGRKMACALYYRETMRFLTLSHFIWTTHVHLMDDRSKPIVGYLREPLPEQVIGNRLNIKDYGQRFGYKCGYKPDEDFFVCASQFGAGFVVISITGDRSVDYTSFPAGERYTIFPAD